MIYTEYGRTGVPVSRLGMGGMRFETPSKTDDMAQVVCHAFERGITYFDTAPGYCDDQSEKIYGRAFKQMKKTGKPFLVATKTMAAKPGEIRAACETSLKRLNVDVIDFHHVWCLVHPEDLGKRKKQGALNAFRQLKEEGLIRHICVSTHLEHDKIAAMLDEGEGLFEGMLIGLNAVNYSLRFPGVHEAAKRGMGIVTMNTLGGGLIPDHADHFKALLRKSGESMVDAALGFNLSLPEVSVALVGFRNISDVDAAVGAVDRFHPLTAANIAALQDKMAAAHQEFCTQCGYCSECPAEVPVVRLMEAFNQRMLNGPEAGLDHLRWHWWTPDVRKVIAACTQCRQCEERCTQRLPILARFQQLCEDHERLRK